MTGDARDITGMPWDRDESPDAVAPAGRVWSPPLPVQTLVIRVRGALARSGVLVDLGRPGLRMLLFLGLVAVLVGGAYAWWSRPSVEPLGPPLPAGVPSAVPSVAAAPHTATSIFGVSSAVAPAGMFVDRSGQATAPGAPGAQVIVHVTGKVKKPGVITLPFGSRVADAVTAAGGLRAGAAADGLNLARRLTDGEQIIVGATGRPGSQILPMPEPDPVTGAVVDLNTATSSQLETLPGVGEVLARRIIDFRQTHAGFRAVDQLRQVTGIGERKFADLRDKVRV